MGHRLCRVVAWAQSSQHRGDHSVYSVGRPVQGQGAFPAWRAQGDPAPWVGLAEARATKRIDSEIDLFVTCAAKLSEDASQVHK